ncbi:hypothetical protein P4475_08830 [Halalkalibacterium halodurans]|uniref:hypothetical protein n=1 Tax=Halalkalibacterium halodurans TaxID=86665 RepID=UPI002E1A8038|nr:hypothetical protein [Halalkalibacterium halodurans]
MQITSQLQPGQQPSQERSTSLREGDILRATITERRGEHEAVLSVRGREIVATFKEGVPKGERVTVEVAKAGKEPITVRSITEDSRGTQRSVESPPSSSARTVLEHLGVKQPSTELVRAAQILLDKGIQLTGDGVRELQRFVASGDTDKRLETIQALANKRLELTGAHLRSIHEALHGRPINDVMQELVKEVDRTFHVDGRERTVAQDERNASVQVMRERIEQLLRQHTLPENTKTQLVKVLEQLPKMNNDALAQVERVIQGIEARMATGERAPNLGDVIQTMRQQLQTESDFLKAIEQVRNDVMTRLGEGPRLQMAVEQAIQAAEARFEQGRELSARQIVHQALDQLEQEAVPKENVPSTGLYQGQEQFQTAVALNSKAIAVTTVTEKMADLTDRFKTFQRDISRHLVEINRIIEQVRSQANRSAQPLLETTIKKLDHAILKGEFMLFADMKTEKRLMQASGQLAEAKKLLAKGQHHEANRIVQEVKQLVDRLHYKPSETKVMHYTSPASRDTTLPQLFVDTARQVGQDASARGMFEAIRAVGLNRDSELAQQFASGRDPGQHNSQSNMKALLLHMLRSEEEGSRTFQLANQALNNVTGQQLLSKADHHTNMQTLFMNLPFLLEKQVENLQVFVQSRNEGQKVDWENCSLFFLIETKKLGEIGILVQVVDRQLSVTLKNDLDDFPEKMEPLVEKTSERIEEIGYQVSGIKFAKATDVEVKRDEDGERAQQPTQPIFTEKGFDFKI